jgi:hypothetical protein
VSIKNKLVTAITTAGLLAGLFGSAFVPAARAAVAIAADLEVICSTTDGDVDDTTPAADNAGDTCYVVAGKTIDLSVKIVNPGDGFIAGTATATLTGTTFVSATTDTSGLATFVWNVAPNLKSANATWIASGTEDDADDYETTFRVVAPAAGVTATVVFFSDTAGTDEVTVTLIGRSSKVNGIPSQSDSTFDAECSPDDGTIQDVGGGTCAVLSRAWFVAGDPAGWDFTVEDGYSDPVTDGYLASATISGTSGVAGVTLVNAGDCAAVTDDSSTSDVGFDPTGDGNDHVCLLNDGATLGIGTVTFTMGAVTKSYDFGFHGTLSSLSLSGPAEIPAGDHDELRQAWGDAFALVAKDAYGTRLDNGGGLAADVATDGGVETGYFDGADEMDSPVFAVIDQASVSIAVTDSQGAEDAYDGIAVGALEFADDLVYDLSAAGTIDDFAISEAEDNAYNVPLGLCGEDEEGETRSITATIGTLTSNAIKVTCVSDTVKIISMTALATGTSGSATSGKNGQTIKVQVVAEDGMGNPAGAGAYFAFTATKSDANATAGTTIGAFASAVQFSAGKATLTITLGANSGSQYVIYSAVDGNEYTTAKEAFAQKISFTVTNDADAFTALSISVGPKGRVVTASGFNAGETVVFEVENARTGVVRQYNRKANASGVATWGNATGVLKYVTAIDSDDNLTDTISVRRK